MDEYQADHPLEYDPPTNRPREFVDLPWDQYQADLPPDHLADRPLEYDPPTDRPVDLPPDHRVDFPGDPLDPPQPSYISGEFPPYLAEVPGAARHRRRHILGEFPKYPDGVPGAARHQRPPSYISEGDETYINLVVPLYQAAITGDWESAKIILDQNPDMVRTNISSNHDRLLHMAVTATESKLTINFVDNLVKLMTPEELAIKDSGGRCTAFLIACSLGKLEMAKIMYHRNYLLLHIEGDGCPPLTIAAKNGHHSTLKWLYSMLPITPDPPFNSWMGSPFMKHDTIMKCVGRGFYDVALQILKDHPDQQSKWLTTFPILYTELFTSLAKNPAAFNMEEKNLIRRIKERICRIFGMKGQPVTEEDTDALKILKIVWKLATKKMSYDDIKDMLRGSSTTLDDGSVRYLSRVLFVAAEVGNTRFIAELLRTYHGLMTDTNEDGLTIFHVAVMHRHQGVYNLLYEVAGSIKDTICGISDNSDYNTLLHLVGKTSKQVATKTHGASLLMQRELLWYQEVYNMTPAYLRETKNKHRQTPSELFSVENKDLVSKGLEWMKDCMVVATLIVTVAFAAAFTVPGGYKGENGLPFFIHQPTMLVFVIADAISLFSSSTSLLVFLTILISGHGQQDFMYSLPTKLMIGILTLFISVAAMMVTFSASFFVLYHKGLKWVPILIAVFVTIPVIAFATLQFPLLVDMFRSMYDSRYLFNPKKHVLYPKKPKLHPKKST